MPTMLRCAALTLLAALALSGCTVLGPGEPAADNDSGCGDCAAETEALRAELDQLPGLSELEMVEYGSEDTLERSPTLTVQARVTDAEAGTVHEGIVEAAWRSDLDPLDVVIVVTQDAAGEIVNEQYVFRTDAERYTRKYGPRPVS
ncbi:MAG TPA: hypothetical protein VLA97_17980 [Nocardioidaceae bacterium]|nr:hypothetical protein [Nocardioidaceae bacterium]